MMPFYGYTDSAYPMLPNQYHHRPGFEAVPPYMTGDVPRPGGGYGHWPFYGCNRTRYPGPGPCHSCLNHGSFPVGPYPFPHQSHCWGYQNPVPGASNAQCVVPPRYEYDMWVPGERHCCGCPNHAHRGKEEPEPDEGKMKSKSLVPFQSGYPVVWVPNEQVKGPEPTKDVDQSASESRVPNGWFPFDLKSLESLLKAGGVSGGEEHGNGERQFPFPIVWFPAKNMETKADKEVSGRGKSYYESEHKLPCVSEFVPVKLPDQCEGSKELEKLQDRNGLEMNKQNSSRIIEVKQISSPTESNSDATQSIVGKSSEASSKKQLSSADKSSKLPPVCLRVEPLSKKKKNGNGASRSPSPPKSKSSTPRSQLEANMERDPQGRNDTTSDMKDAEEAQKSEAKVGETSTASQPQVPVELALETREVSKPNGEDGEPSSVKAGSSCATEATKPEEAMQEGKADWGDGEAQAKIITDEEAALRIQSVYHGYNVRRWEPLKKLKLIAQAREQLTDVRSRIDALDFSVLQKADKQAVVIGELIMSLLLKLDTVQGRLPIIRDMRKSVARELVALQERLDTKVENEISRGKHANSLMLVSGEVGGVNEQDPVQQDGNNGMLEVLDADNRDLSFPEDDVHESKLSLEINGGPRNFGLQDSDHENNYALEIKHAEKSDLEAIVMEETADMCCEERDPPHGMEMEEDSSPENSTPTRAFSCMTSIKEIPEEHLHLESFPGLTCAVEDKMFENPELQDCKIVNGNGIFTDEGGNIFDVDKEDLAYEMNKFVSDDGSENLVGGEPRYVNESLEFCESKEAPSFGVKKQQGKEANDSCSIDEEEGKIEGETENLSENSDSATSEEAEQQTECVDEVNGRPYSEALQREGKLLACPELPDSKSFDELRGGEGSYDRDVEVVPVPEQKNIDATHEEDELLLTNADGSVSDKRAEVVKASEETQGAEQSTIVANVVIAPDAAGTNDDGEARHTSSEPSSVATWPFIDDKRLAEENAKLWETMEKLIESGREQLIVLSNLTGRVKDLEQKLSRKKRKQTRRCRTAKSPHSRSRVPMFEELEQ